MCWFTPQFLAVLFGTGIDQSSEPGNPSWFSIWVEATPAFAPSCAASSGTLLGNREGSGAAINQTSALI